MWEMHWADFEESSTCFGNIPKPPARCNSAHATLDIKQNPIGWADTTTFAQKFKECKSAFGECSRALKMTGPFVNQCPIQF